MSLIATAIKFMKSGGMSADMILEAVVAMEEAMEGDPVAARRRAYDRERKREERLSGGMSADNASSLSSLSKEGSKKERKKEARGVECPVDFRPNEGNYEVGRKCGHSRESVDHFAVVMLEWSQANKHRPVARKSDWHKTLNGFLRREKPTKKPNGTGPPMVNGAPSHGEERDGRIWFHMDSEAYRNRGETRTDRYCGWWFDSGAAG